MVIMTENGWREIRNPSQYIEAREVYSQPRNIQPKLVDLNNYYRVFFTELAKQVGVHKDRQGRFLYRYEPMTHQEVPRRLAA
jgi:hypothetical protein